MIPVCRLEDLPEGESVRVGTTPPVAVFNADGELYAIDDTCTHQDASLSEGWLEGCLIECPLHAASFDLRTGSTDVSPGPPPCPHPPRHRRRRNDPRPPRRGGGLRRVNSPTPVPASRFGPVAGIDAARRACPSVPEAWPMQLASLTRLICLTSPTSAV